MLIRLSHWLSARWGSVASSLGTNLSGNSARPDRPRQIPVSTPSTLRHSRPRNGRQVRVAQGDDPPTSPFPGFIHPAGPAPFHGPARSSPSTAGLVLCTTHTPPAAQAPAPHSQLCPPESCRVGREDHANRSSRSQGASIPIRRQGVTSVHSPLHTICIHIRPAKTPAAQPANSAGNGAGPPHPASVQPACIRKCSPSLVLQLLSWRR